LPGGKIFSDGVVSIADVLAGDPATLSAVGISGIYRGMVGTREFTLVAETAEHNYYSTSIKVCR
jgi:hypothetical protein